MISKLLDKDVHTKAWDFSRMNQLVEDYRRRMVPFYLLGDESDVYPLYLDNSDMNRFTQDGSSSEDSISINKVKIHTGDQLTNNFSFTLQDVSLLSTADNVIKQCKRKLEKQTQLSDQTRIAAKFWSDLKKHALLSDSTVIGDKTWRQIKLKLDLDMTS